MRTPGRLWRLGRASNTTEVMENIMAQPAKVYHLPNKPRRQPSVNSWRWNELEDEALLTLPPEIERLYLHGIRKHMDYATGIAGRKRRVSMDMFDELLTYHPPAGSREAVRSYSRQQITRMIDKLENAGLVERLHRGKGVKAPMEFRLPLACSDADQHRADSEQGGASQENPHSRASEEVNSEQGASREERATSGSPSITSTDVEVRIGGEDPQPANPKASGLPDCPHMEILDLWAEIMPDKPQPAKTMWPNTERARHLAARWKAGFTLKHASTGEPLYIDRETGIAWWGRFFKFLRNSEFLMGDNRWFKLDWVVNKTNFVKIMELAYHDGGES